MKTFTCEACGNTFKGDGTIFVEDDDYGFMGYKLCTACYSARRWHDDPFQWELTTITKFCDQTKFDGSKDAYYWSSDDGSIYVDWNGWVDYYRYGSWKPASSVKLAAEKLVSYSK